MKGQSYYYPNRTSLSASGLRTCLYDEECPGFTSCINHECIMPYLPGHSCKAEPSKGPFLGLKKDVMPGEDEGGCINLTCDTFTRTCQFEDKRQEEDSYAAISCTMDGDCPYQHSCDFMSGACLKMPTLGETCTASCIKPYICYQGMCRQPCLSDYDCYIGSARTDTTAYSCMTVYNACTVSAEATRPSETELDLFFGKVPESFKRSEKSDASSEKAPARPQKTTFGAPIPVDDSDADGSSGGSSTAPEPTPVRSKLPASGGSDSDDIGSAADGASADGEKEDSNKIIMYGAAAGAAIVLIVLILIIWRVIKKRRNRTSTISTSAYGRKSNYPSQTPAYASAMPSTTSDYKDPNFGMKSNQGSGLAEPPPKY